MIRRLAGAAVLGAMALAFSGQALAQKPEEIPAKMLTGPDVEAIKEGMKTIHAAGSCKVTYVVSKVGKVKDAKADCTIPEMAPFALKAMETMTYTPDMFDGSAFESDEKVQPFNWPASNGAGGSPAAATGSQPVNTKPMDSKAINRAIIKVGKPGKCDLTFTVGVNGKPKDIKPNCDPAAYNDPISKAAAEMTYTPGMKDGKPVDTPDVKYPLNLATQTGK